MTKRNPLPPYELVRELFDYEPATGLLRWRVKRAQMNVGDIAGAVRGEGGYLQVSINCKLYRVHLIIWLWMTGEDPPHFLDHRDTDKSNNRWLNLRPATKSQNQANIGRIASNKSGFKGVSRYKQGEAWGKPWQSAIVKDGVHYHVGHFANAEEAHAAYMKMAKELYGDYARAS